MACSYDIQSSALSIAYPQVNCSSFDPTPSVQYNSIPLSHPAPSANMSSTQNESMIQRLHAPDIEYLSGRYRFDVRVNGIDSFRTSVCFLADNLYP